MRFSRYYNHEAGNRNIYSRRNLLNMSLEELLRRELELAYQYNTIGIPMDEELANSQYAHSYIDDKGFSYWQAGEERQREQLRQQKSDMMYENARQQLENNVQGFGINAPKQYKTGTPQITPISEPINQDNNMLEGFGQLATKGISKLNKPNPFPDLVNKEELEKLGGIVKPSEPNYFRDPNATVVIDERGWPTLRKKGSLDSKNGEPWDYSEELPEESAPEETAEELLEENIPEETSEELPEEEVETSEEEKTAEPYLTMEDLLGDESDEERELREKAELEAFDRAWDKANGVEENVFTNPSRGTLNATIIKDDIYTPYDDEIEKNPNLTEEEKVAKKLEVLNIQKAAKAREKEINIDNIRGLAKIYGKEILPYAIPEALPAKMVTSTSKLLKPFIEKPLLKFGNKIKGKLSESLAKTTIASPIESSLEALDEKKNPVKTVLKNYPKDIVEGAVLGILDVNLDKSKTKDSIKKSVEKWNIRQQRKQHEKSVQYYNDYIKGTSKDIGLEEWLEELLRKHRK